MNIKDIILAMRAPELTPEFIALHERIANAQLAGTLADALLNECTDPECLVCGQIMCPYGEPLHFHHDGCPACAEDPVCPHCGPGIELQTRQCSMGNTNPTKT